MKTLCIKNMNLAHLTVAAIADLSHSMARDLLEGHVGPDILDTLPCAVRKWVYTAFTNEAQGDWDARDVGQWVKYQSAQELRRQFGEPLLPEEWQFVEVYSRELGQYVEGVIGSQYC